VPSDAAELRRLPAGSEPPRVGIKLGDTGHQRGLSHGQGHHLHDELSFDLATIPAIAGDVVARLTS